MTNLVEHRLGRLLVRVQTPVSAEDDTLLRDSVSDWALTSVYGQPLPARTFSEDLQQPARKFAARRG